MSVVYDAKKVQAMTPAQVAALAPAEFLKFDKGGVSQLQGAKFSTLNIERKSRGFHASTPCSVRIKRISVSAA